MTINNLHRAIANLSAKRNAFWSEADFQFALAWELKQILPNANIHLERCYQLPNHKDEYRIDIWIEEQGKIFPIELKYKTKNATILQNGTTISLKNHGAVDLGCYDYLKDIARIENIASNEPSFERGFTVILTNEHKYYTQMKAQSAYDNFKIYQGAIRTGNLTWMLTRKGTTFVYNSRCPFLLKGVYTMNWTPYNSGQHGFMYLINVIQ